MAGLQGPASIQRQISGEEVDQSSPVQSSYRSSDVDLDNEDDILSANVPPSDLATYAYHASTDVPDTADDVNLVFILAPGGTEQDFYRTAAAMRDPRTVDAPYEAMYERIDDLRAPCLGAWSSTYWRHGSSLPGGQTRSIPGRYRRCQSYDVIGRRTLPRGTLLLVNSDDDDDHVTGCDVTRSIAALDRQANVFYVPRSSLGRFDDSSSQPWFYPTPLTSHQATVFVATQRQNGCFVVYVPAAQERSTEGRPEYVLAVGLSQGETQGQTRTDLSSNLNFLVICSCHFNFCLKAIITCDKPPLRFVQRHITDLLFYTAVSSQVA